MMNVDFAFHFSRCIEQYASLYIGFSDIRRDSSHLNRYGSSHEGSLRGF